MKPRHRIPRIILSPFVFFIVTLASATMFIFPWWLIIGMHLLNLVYEILRLPFTYLGVETPDTDPIINTFNSKIANNFVSIFLPIIAPFHITYIFIANEEFK